VPRVDHLYLDLLKQVLTRNLMLDQEVRDVRPRGLAGMFTDAARRKGYRLVAPMPGSQAERAAVRAEGKDWPSTAETMIGLARLDNLQHCIETALADNVPGDVIETGVWRGGACIFMRGVLAAHDVTDRKVWVADSFKGLPEDDGRDPGDIFHTYEALAVDLDTVRRNFERYGLLDDQVVFLEGWFKDTLPDAPIEHLAVVRLDGDMYGSTWDAIDALYPKLEPGGFLIVDDYGAVEGCRRAITDYREAHRVTEPIEEIDWAGVFWRKDDATV
jgi:O-methyltransferase